MIVWSGRGITIILVFIAVLLLNVWLIPNEYLDYGLVLSFFITGIYCWHFGKKWNNQDTRWFIDEKTGQRVLFKGNHGLFWIKMQYWSIICGILGIITLLKNSIIIASITTGVFISILLFLYFNKTNEQLTDEHQSSKKQKTLQKEQQTLDAEETEERLIRRQEKEDPCRFMPK